MKAPGVSTGTIADMLVVLGDNPQRIRSEAAFAKLCGVCPVPASSGKTSRHRLNRGGNRRANAALYQIALHRMRHHPPTRDYIQRRTAEGNSTSRDPSMPQALHRSRYFTSIYAPTSSR
jgi:transposase